MKSIPERHSEILKDFMRKTRPRNLLQNFRLLRHQFNEIGEEKTFTADPFVDEVCSNRLTNLIHAYFEIYVPGFVGEESKLHELRVSDLPPIEQISNLKRGFGRISQIEYADLIKKYRNNEK